MEEVVRLGLRADRERGDPSLGMGFSLQDAKALRSAAGKKVDLTGDARVSPEEALFARVQTEVVRQDKVGLFGGGGGREKTTPIVRMDGLVLFGLVWVGVWGEAVDILSISDEI